MRFGTCCVRGLYRSGSLTAGTKQLGRYKLHSGGVQEVRWNKGGTVIAGIIFFLWKKNRKLPIGNRIYLHHRIISAVKRRVFVGERMSY